jgi:hypothetical protein
MGQQGTAVVRRTRAGATAAKTAAAPRPGLPRPGPGGGQDCGGAQDCGGVQDSACRTGGGADAAAPRLRRRPDPGCLVPDPCGCGQTRLAGPAAAQHPRGRAQDPRRRAQDRGGVQDPAAAPKKPGGAVRDRQAARPAGPVRMSRDELARRLGEK